MEETRTAITGKIKEFASAQPDKAALIIHDRIISYGELYGRISAAAAYLSKAGVGKGAHVVTVASPELAYIACEYAILGLGAVNIPTENRIPPQRLGEIATSVNADFVLSYEAPCCDARWIPYDAVKTEEGADLFWEPVPVSDECSEIIFTTGTTGKSKGVMLSSHCLEVYLAAINPTFRMKNDTVFLVTTPLNHVGGLHRIHQCMSVGCTAVLLDGIKDLKTFFRSIHAYGVTHTYLPPASVKLLLTLAKKDLAALDGKLQFIYTASAPFPPADIEKLMGILPNTRLHQGYGSSETGSICNCQYNAPGETITSLGKPYDCVEVILHDEDGNVVTEPGCEGYIRSRSAMNMIGYYQEPELTASVLKDGFIYSHDLMYFDDRGELHYAGRGDDVINVRGFKVAPTEVENAALRFEKVVDCACIPFDDPSFGKVVKLLVVMKEGAAFDAGEISAYLEGTLEPYKVPRIIEAVDGLPRTFNGKLDRKAVIRQYGR